MPKSRGRGSGPHAPDKTIGIMGPGLFVLALHVTWHGKRQLKIENRFPPILDVSTSTQFLLNGLRLVHHFVLERSAESPHQLLSRLGEVLMPRGRLPTGRYRYRITSSQSSLSCHLTQVCKHIPTDACGDRSQRIGLTIASCHAFSYPAIV